MKIELISFDRKFNIHPKNKHEDAEKCWDFFFDLAVNLINTSDSDVIVFCGGTIQKDSDIDRMTPLITNNHIVAVVEAWNDSVKYTDKELKSDPYTKSIKLRNRVYVWNGNQFSGMGTHQVFLTSEEATEKKVDELLTELSNRQFKVGDKTFVILQCEELNILKNLWGDGNVAVFRCRGNYGLNKRFERRVSKTDVWLNILHIPMGEQGMFARRREFLSSNGKLYFSMCNSNNVKLNEINLQYAYKDGKILKEICVEGESGSLISRIYEI